MTGTRRSLTKTQLQTPAGAELLLLCQTITEDGRITEGEVKELGEWLGRNRDSGLPSEDFLTLTVERILADGRVTPDELAELQAALETVLPPELRKDAQQRRRAATKEERDTSKAQAAAIREDWLLQNGPIADYDFMVAGVWYEGRPGILQRYLADDFPDATVYLRRDATNPHSHNAVRVVLTDGQTIGFVPEMSRDGLVSAQDVARYLDAGARHSAWIKKMLTGGRVPIPVVVAELFDADAVESGGVTQAEVPGPTVPPPPPPAPRRARPAARPPAPARRESATPRWVVAVLIGLVWLVAVALLLR